MIENSMYKNQIDQKNSRILSLEDRIKELEKQLKESITLRKLVIERLKGGE